MSDSILPRPVVWVGSILVAAATVGGCGSESTADVCASGVELEDGGCGPISIDDAGGVTDGALGDVNAADGSSTDADPDAATDVAADILVEDADVVADAPVCAPACDGRVCGDDGCGGVCGSCMNGEICTDAGICGAACVPVCDGLECGPDGCGGTCGECAPNFGCDAAGQCEPLFGTDVCPDVLACADACGTVACVEACERAGTVAAQGEFQALQQCTVERCPLLAGEELATCRETLCNLTWSACFGVAPTSGDLTCVEAARCIVSCADAACESDCVAQATVEAQTEVNELFACADTECTGPVGGEAWVECVEVACPTAELCLEGPPIAGGCSAADRAVVGASGAPTRSQIAACGNSCADVLGPDLCARDCIEEAMGVSTDCAVCGAELAVCIATDCADECTAPSSDDCNDCLDDDNCLRDLNRCLLRAPGAAP